MKLRLPFDGLFVVTQTFDEHLERAMSMRAAYNGGIDYGMPTGTPVLAAADGSVTKATEDASGYGRLVKIRHAESVETLYAHLRTWSVRPGQSVSAGEQIGYSDSTGFSSGPHLHFEVRRNGRPVDPQELLTPITQYVDPQPLPAPINTTPLMIGQHSVALDGVRLRSQPGLDGHIILEMIAGTSVVITGMAQPCDGLQWYPVRIVVYGWTAANSPDGTRLLE